MYTQVLGAAIRVGDFGECSGGTIGYKIVCPGVAVTYSFQYALSLTAVGHAYLG